MRWRERFEFRVDDRVLVVNRTGSASPAPVVVLVHGIGAGPNYYARLARALGSRARVEVVELPGHATAPRPASRLTVDDYGALLALYLQRSGHERVILVGHSMGAQVASRAAALEPGLIRRLFLLGPVVDPAAPTALGQALRLTLDTLRETPAANVGVFSDYLRCGPSWYLATLTAMLSFDTAAEGERLREAGVPTVLVRGSRDPIASLDWCRTIARAAGAPEPLDIAGSAHVVQWTAAHEIAFEILGSAR
ncbi:MAG: alpha/beta hydrolase [Naasia sp.]